MSLESDVKESKRVVEPVDVDDCVVCHEPLADSDDERTLVKLRCTHKYHLDCIGSFFNSKNRMECPCCRKIEKGQWLFAKAVEPGPSLPDINFDSVLDGIQGVGIRSLPDSPTLVWSDSVLSTVDSQIDRIFTSSPRPIAYAPNQITDNGNTRFNIWSNDTASDTRIQRQIEEHLALIADSERRLHDMMYELHVGSRGTTNGGESSGGGNDESSSGEAVAGEVAADAAEGTEE